MSLIYKEPTKLSIAAIDGDLEIVNAQYNPKELSVDKSTQWDQENSQLKTNAKPLVFKAGTNMTMSFELFFDGYEENKDVGAEVAKLMAMTKIYDESAQQSDLMPPRVLVIFGTGKVEWIRGVIESLGIKYTMFNADGVPVRATCSVKIKEVPADGS